MFEFMDVEIEEVDLRDPAVVALCVALIKDVVECIEYGNLPYSKKTKAMMIDLFNALSWIESKSDRVLSFKFCCEYLDWDPGSIRMGIIAKCPTEDTMLENKKIRDFISLDIHNRGRKTK